MSEIRDPIYGFITPSDTELKIVNTLEVEGDVDSESNLLNGQ